MKRLGRRSGVLVALGVAIGALLVAPVGMAPAQGDVLAQGDNANWRSHRAGLMVSAVDWPINQNVHVENDLGVKVSAPDTSSGFKCWWWAGGAYVCFKYYGDIFYVKDTKADGHSADAIWEFNIRCGSGHWCLYRQGVCRNASGNGTWVRCDKDFYEHDELWFTDAISEGWDIINYFADWAWACPSGKASDCNY